ncbi:pyridoxine 5'-phosphate synthase, partial [Janthinobacterium sp. AD80]|uniref:pyridoxine 5'-phosphate synthase n=1 Tax=Janthinobacterium sp. AD80 TaxID=1528773 RepID=UPI002155812B
LISMSMTQLSVNVNKIALLRNSRGRNFPDLLAFSAAGRRRGRRPADRHPPHRRSRLRHSTLRKFHHG